MNDFCILSSYRSGSEALVSALNSHSQIICHSELYAYNNINFAKGFNSELSISYRNSNPIEFYDCVVKESKKIKPVVGFKIFSNHNLKLLFYLARNIKFIFLERENKLDQYASTLVGHLGKPHKVHFDYEHFLKFVVYLRHEKEVWIKNAEELGTNYCCISYEDVIESNFESVLEFLGVLNENIKISTKKLNPKLTADKFDNFEKLEFILKNTEYFDWIIHE